MIVAIDALDDLVRHGKRRPLHPSRGAGRPRRLPRGAGRGDRLTVNTEAVYAELDAARVHAVEDVKRQLGY